MFSSLRLARSRSQSSTTSCTGGPGGSGASDKEATLNGDTLTSDRHVDRHGDKHVDRHVYQVTPQHGSLHVVQGLSSCPTSPLLSGKPPKTPRSIARRGSSKWGLDKALCPSIGNLRDRAVAGAVPRWDDDADPPGGRGGRGGRGSRGGSSPSSDVCTCSKVTRVAITRQDGCLGITVRGGTPQRLVITSVHPGGPADREGSIHPGDRLLAVDGTNLQLADLSTAHTALRGHRTHHHGGYHQAHRDSSVAVLTIEYSVCVVGAVVGAQGPLLVELARPPAHQLGLTLRTDRGDLHRTAVIVDDIKAASVADRSGALHHGDQILAVDEVRVDGSDFTASDAVALLSGVGGAGGMLQLEILPAHCRHPGSPQRFGNNYQRSPCPSEYTPLRSLRAYDNGSLASSTGGSGSAGGAGGAGLVSHTETLSLLLRPEPISGYGVAVRASGVSRTPTISALHPDGPAERSGCLQVGDRIVAVDDREVDAEQLALLLDNPGPPLSLRVSFSVAESVVPASGVFTVKLAKCRPGLGITITGNKTGEFLYISDIKCGSVAHRSGTLAVGDRLLEIDGLSLNIPSSGSGLASGRDLGRALDHAARILHNSGDVVTLKVLKDEAPSELGSNWGGWGLSGAGPAHWMGNWTRSIEYPIESHAASLADGQTEQPLEYSVEYTVELVRHGGPLGLTIAGSEDPSDSVTISGLTSGGLAEQTGALHVGDRLLAINGESLRGRRLSEAIMLFQNSTDVVTLKIARTRIGITNQTHRTNNTDQNVEHESMGLTGRFGSSGPAGPHPAIPSVDSAVESWDSSPSQRNTSPAGTPMSTSLSPLGHGQAPAQVPLTGRVKLTPLPVPQPSAGPTSPSASAPGQPLSRRAGSCPSLDCLLQTESTNHNQHPDWDGPDGSLEDLESAAATAATLSLRICSTSSTSREEAAGGSSPGGVLAPSPPVSPPASFRQGAIAGPWPRPPPSPLPGVLGGRGLTAAKALNNDWQQRQRQQQQQLKSLQGMQDDTVDNLATPNKLSSFQWTNNNATLQHSQNDSNSSSIRNLDDFSELNNNLLRQAGQSGPGPLRHLVFDEHLCVDLENSAQNRRASSLLLEEAAADALQLQDLGLQHPMHLYQVTIYKDSVYEDFGFSVSDGLYERGVFINRIRKGGPADVSGVLQPYDRILQVNDTRTYEFDCCLTVPLIAAAGDRIQLIVARHQDAAYQLPLDDSYLESTTVTQTI